MNTLLNSLLKAIVVVAMLLTPTRGLIPRTIPTRLFIRLLRGELEPCSAYLAESIPEGLDYPSCAPSHLSTAFAWEMLIFEARKNISIASFYWSMLREDVYNSSSAYQVTLTVD